MIVKMLEAGVVELDCDSSDIETFSRLDTCINYFGLNPFRSRLWNIVCVTLLTGMCYMNSSWDRPIAPARLLVWHSRPVRAGVIGAELRMRAAQKSGLEL